MTTPFSRPARLSMAALVSSVCLASASIFCSVSHLETVTPSVEVIDQTNREFGASFITSITGTYGAGCSGRAAAGTDTWTVSLLGGPAPDELSVRTNNSTCVLTLTDVITTEGTFIGAPPIVLRTTGSASPFAKSASPLAFYGEATISALTFATNFTITLIVSEDPSAVDGGINVASFKQAGDVPALLTTRSFAILAGQTVTNTGIETAIIGNLGISPGTSVTGLPIGQPVGAIYLGSNGVAVKAQADLTTLYNDLAGRPCPPSNVLSGRDLSGMTLAPGVYCFSAAATLDASGKLTLDAKHDTNAFWVFQMGSTLHVDSGAVIVINGGTPCNVFWQVGSSATLAAGAQLEGNIVALTSIMLLTGASVSPGRALARNGAVTMDTNVVSMVGCQ